MADGIAQAQPATLPGGVEFQVDYDGSGHAYPYTKVVWGASGTQNETSAANPLPVNVVAGGGGGANAVPIADASGTIATGAFTDQTALAAGDITEYFQIFNVNINEYLYLNFGGAAGNGAGPTAGAIPIPPMGSFPSSGPMTGVVPSTAIHVAANTATHAYVLKYF
jgi:hypothetical protein